MKSHQSQMQTELCSTAQNAGIIASLCGIDLFLPVLHPDLDGGQ